MTSFLLCFTGITYLKARENGGNLVPEREERTVLRNIGERRGK